MNLIEAYLCIFDRLFSKIIKLREESFIIHGHSLWRSNIRPHNIQLSDYIFGEDYGILSKLLASHNLEAIVKKVKLIFDGVSFCFVKYIVLFWG
jgi:hypothetical protein